MQEEYAKGVIKDWEMPPLVNMKTGETTGFAVVIYVGTKYDYTEELLTDWKERFDADEYKVSARRNQLALTFTIRTFEPTEAHIAKISHAIGLDNEQPEEGGCYKAYRNGSWYDGPDPLWDELVLSGFATDQRKPKNYSYYVTPKGMRLLARHHKIMIKYTEVRAMGTIRQTIQVGQRQSDIPMYCPLCFLLSHRQDKRRRNMEPQSLGVCL